MQSEQTITLDIEEAKDIKRLLENAIGYFEISDIEIASKYRHVLCRKIWPESGHLKFGEGK